MYLKNEKGLTLVELLITITIVVFSIPIGYEILKQTTIKTSEELESNTALNGVLLFNRLFISEIYFATDLELTETPTQLILKYNTDSPKELIFTQRTSTEYTLTYKHNPTKPNPVALLTVKTDGITKPVRYNTTTNILSFNFEYETIMYNTDIKIRRDKP